MKAWVFKSVLIFVYSFFIACGVAQAASLSGTTIPSASKIVDSSGNIWTVVSGGADRNGVNAGSSSGVALLLYYNNIIYAKSTSGSWWQWEGAYFNKISSNPMSISASGTTIPSASNIVDSSGNIWTLTTGTSTTGPQIAENGVTQSVTNHVSLLLYYKSVVYQENSWNNWWSWTGSAWTSTSNPLTEIITASAGSNGTINPSGSVSVNNGASQTFTLTPSTGYTASLTVDGTAVTLTNNSYTLSNVTTSHTLAASFTLKTEIITTSAGSNGSISPSGAVSVNYGASQTFTVTPSTGYTASLTVDGTAVTLTNNSYTLSNVTTSHTLAASFTLKTEIITTSAGSNGSISPSGAVSVNYGASQTFTVTPSTGYTASLTVDGAAVTLSNNAYTLSNVTASHTVAASFTLLVSPSGTTIPSASSIVDSSKNIWTLVSGQALENGADAGGSAGVALILYYNGVIYADSPSGGWWIYQGTYFTQVSGDPRTPPTETITASAGSNGTISPSGSVSVNYGASQTFTVTPSTGYTASLTVDGAAVTLSNNTYTLSDVITSHTVAASFTLLVSPNGTTVPSAQQIADSSGNVWTLTPGAQIAENGVIESATNGVILLLYYNGVVYQENTWSNWYSWTGSTWTQDSGDPRSSSSSSTSMLPPVGYTSKPVLDDQFNTSSLNLSNWNPCIGNDLYKCWGDDGQLGSYSGANQPGSFQIQYDDTYPAGGGSNISGNHLVTGNGLRMISTQISPSLDVPGTSTTFSSLGYSWAAAGVSSFGKAYIPATGGYVQFYAKMPNSLNGAWGGLWFLSKSGNGAEMDLQESGYPNVNQGTAAPNANYTLASHWQGPGGSQIVQNVGVDLSAAYHTYGIEYNPGKWWKVYLDGNLMASWINGVNGVVVPAEAYEILIDFEVANNPNQSPSVSGWHTLSNVTDIGSYEYDVSEVQVYNLAQTTTTSTTSVSASGTTIPSASSIVDSSGNTWTLVSGGVNENGAIAGGAASGTTLILYYNGVIYTDSSSGSWWQWEGSYFNQISGDPRSTGGGACGTANGVGAQIMPSSNLCPAGSTASAVTGLGPWGWTCSANGASTSCSASVTALAPPSGWGTSQMIFDDTFKNLNNWNFGVTNKSASGWPWNASGSSPNLGSAQQGVDYGADGFDSEYYFPSQVWQTSSAINGTFPAIATGITGNPYTPNTFSPSGSGLSITAVPYGSTFTLSTSTGTHTYSWYSGAINTYGKFELGGTLNGVSRHVYIQVMEQSPSVLENGALNDNGAWTGIWSMPGPDATADVPYDDFEFESGYVDLRNGTGNPDSTLLGIPETQTEFLYTSTTGDLSVGYHVYGIDWVSGTSMKFYIDGVLINTYLAASNTSGTAAPNTEYNASIPSQPNQLLFPLSMADSNASYWHSVATDNVPMTVNVSEIQVYDQCSDQSC